MPSFKTAKEMFASFPKAAASKLDSNINNFLVGKLTTGQDATGEGISRLKSYGLAGMAAFVFKRSFEIHGFYSKNRGGPWQVSKASNKRGNGNTTLYESGALMDSITISGNIQGHNHKSARIFTDPKEFAEKPYSHRGTCYAAIHNFGPPYTYGRHGGLAVQRQFMGHSTYIDEYIKTHQHLIFQGFPVTSTVQTS